MDYLVNGLCNEHLASNKKNSLNESLKRRIIRYRDSDTSERGELQEGV